MQENMADTNTKDEWVGRFPFAIPKRLVDTVTKDGDHLLFELGHALRQITSCEVQCENPILVTGESVAELSSTPDDILWNLQSTKIQLPDSIRERLKEWKNKILPYTLKNTLNDEERDELVRHVVHLRRFLFEEVVNPALKNNYPSIESKEEKEGDGS